MTHNEHYRQDDPGITALGIRLANHVETRLEYTRITLTEKLALALTGLFSSGVTLLLAALCLFFLSLAAGLWIGRYCGDYVAGFGAVGGCYLVLLILYRALRKSVFEKRMLDAIVVTLCEQENTADDDDDEA